ncbi:hypothetical protein D3C85_1094830 [compost metagenome]
MAAAASGNMLIPAWDGEYPIATCSSKGTRKGRAPLPRRANRLPRMPTAKVRVLNSEGANMGLSICPARSQYAARQAMPANSSNITRRCGRCSSPRPSMAMVISTMAAPNSTNPRLSKRVRSAPRRSGMNFHTA